MLFAKALVANRGECAVRLLRTLQLMGIEAFTIYTEADKSCRHVQAAHDEAIEVSDYSDISAIIKAAKACGAEAIFPGWGFASESPAFAKACHKAGIIFCGPSEEVLKNTGDKEKSKKIAKSCKIPILEGSPATTKGDRLYKWAEKNGLSDAENSTPFMLKVAAGGGGFGNEFIQKLSELSPAIERLKVRGKRYWNSENLFLEPFILYARHIEVQFARDRQGNFLHFGTRDCSLQWQYQKTIEIAPAPNFDRTEDLYEYTKRIADNLQYVGVGTVEFLVSSEGSAYFLEINPRLQVEHGISELITGIDLVEVLVRIAANEPLNLGQDDIAFTGFATEARINTQVVNIHDYTKPLATTGKVSKFKFPDGVRVDHALHIGYEPNLAYNPTQAKLMAKGDTYEDAIKNLSSALGATIIEGVETNIPLLKEILRDQKVKSGEHTLETLPRVVARFARKISAAIAKAVQEDDTSSDKQTAAAIGVSIAYALQQEHGTSSKVPEKSAWRDFGRRMALGNRL